MIGLFYFDIVKYAINLGNGKPNLFQRKFAVCGCSYMNVIINIKNIPLIHYIL